jgi:hypothetical protein
MERQASLTAVQELETSAQSLTQEVAQLAAEKTALLATLATIRGELEATQDESSKLRGELAAAAMEVEFWRVREEQEATKLSELRENLSLNARDQQEQLMKQLVAVEAEHKSTLALLQGAERKLLQQAHESDLKLQASAENSKTQLDNAKQQAEAELRSRENALRTEMRAATTRACEELAEAHKKALQALKTGHENKLEKLRDEAKTASDLADSRTREKSVLALRLSEAEIHRKKLVDEMEWIKEAAATHHAEVDRLQQELLVAKTEAVNSRGQLNQVTGRYMALERELEIAQAARREKVATTELETKVTRLSDEVAAAKQAAAVLANDKKQVMKQLTLLIEFCDKKHGTDPQAAHRLLAETVRLNQEVSKLKQVRKEMRDYVIKYKQKGDEKMSLMQAQLKATQLQFENASSQLGRTAFVLAKYAEFLRAEPEFSSLLIAINSQRQEQQAEQANLSLLHTQPDPEGRIDSPSRVCEDNAEPFLSLGDRDEQ